MTTLAEFMIVVGADNRPPVLNKAMCNLWESLDGQIRKKKYNELTEQEQLQDDCDVQATNFVLQVLPPEVYVLVNTKFLNALAKEWSRFVTNVKLAKNMYTTNYDQLYAYLSQYEGNANEVQMMRERYPDPLALVAHYQTQSNSAHQPTPPVPQNAYHSPLTSQQPPIEFPQIDSGLVVPVFLPGDDPIACFNKAMAFMSTVVASRFPSTNNQLRTSSNPRIKLLFKMVGLLFHKFKEDKQLAFLADLGITDYHDVQPTIIHNAAFQTDDLDAYDSDGDDILFAKAFLMANLSSYYSYVLSMYH
ncbi:hypothetical protein Tco_0188880 [Tanacetum coccineum]